MMIHFRTAAIIRVRTFGCVLALVFLCVTSACADGTVVREKWLERDPRLIAPVTVVRQHIRLGELLQEASRQSGVTLGSNRYDTGDSVVLTVYARKMPLVDLLASVWSIVSYAHATWEWEIKGDGKRTPYRYRLDCPSAAREFPLVFRGMAQKFFEEDMEGAIEALTASPKRAAELAALYPDVQLINDPVDGAGMRAFASLFTPDDRLKLSEGQMPGGKTIPSAQWTPEMNAFRDAVDAMSAAAESKFGLPHTHSFPNTLNVTCTYYGPNNLAPSILFNNGGGSGLGGLLMETALSGRLQSLWMLNGDSAVDTTIEAKLIPPEPKRRELPYRLPWDFPLYRQLNELNQLTRVPVFVRDADDLHFEPAYGKPIGDLLKSLRSSAENVKWHNGSLLISQRGWVRRAVDNADQQVPWQAMQRLRESMMRSKDYSVGLEDLAHLANDITPKQFAELERSEDLLAPNMFLPTSDLCRSVVHFAPLLAPLVRLTDLRTNLMSVSGVRVRELPKETREFLASLTNEIIAADFRVRIWKDVQSPEKYPEMWKGWSAKGLEVGYVYQVEMGPPGAMKSIGGISWYTRDAAMLYKSGQDPEADLRITTFKVFGEPKQQQQ